MPHRYVQLRRHCKAKLDQFDLPRPFSIDALCRRIAQQRGRPLHLHPLPRQAAMAGACGLWLATASDDHIFFEHHTARLHQEHIVLHEIGHMLFDHHAVSGGLGPAGLLADLDPGVVRRLLARTSYTTRQEQEAEMLASLIRAGDRRGRDEPDGVLGRLQAAAGVTVRAATSFRTVWRLWPLWRQLVDAAPQVALMKPRSRIREVLLPRHPWELFEYRKVIETHDAILALRGYAGPSVPGLARRYTAAAGLSGGSLEVTVLACELGEARRAKLAGLPQRPQPNAPFRVNSHTLGDEREFLLRLARAYDSPFVRSFHRYAERQKHVPGE